MDFYRINEDYNKFLQKYEKKKRGVTKVPNIRYTDHNKFAFGAVMQVKGLNYYVSVSSFNKRQEANLLIRVPGDKEEVKGSLRFNYMVPVPDECLEKLIIKDVKDEKYRLLLNKEYQFCMDNAERIQKKANKIYEMVTTNRKQVLTDNSCAFHILEDGCREYIENCLRAQKDCCNPNKQVLSSSETLKQEMSGHYQEHQSVLQKLGQNKKLAADQNAHTAGLHKGGNGPVK